jgi:hypothetical protein
MSGIQWLELFERIKESGKEIVMGTRKMGRVILILVLGLVVITTTAMGAGKVQIVKADRMEWKNAGKEVALTGGVEVRIATDQGAEIVLTAGDVIYSREKNAITATATPKVVQGALNATGESITVDAKTGNIAVAKGTLKGTDATAKADAISIALYTIDLKGAAELTTGMGTFSGASLKLSFTAEGKLDSFVSEQSKGSIEETAPAASPAKKPAPKEKK